MSLLHRASSMGKTTKETKEKDREKKKKKPKTKGNGAVEGRVLNGDKTETMLSLKKRLLGKSDTLQQLFFLS